jgi:hypothetical protein
MMRFIALLFFLFGTNFSSVAQVSIGEFIKSANEDPEVKTFEEQARYLEQRTYRLPFLQRLEFRTQNRELLANQQEYALRITPSNPWEVRNNNRYFEEYRNSLGFEKEFLLKTALQERYAKVISLLYLADFAKKKSLVVESKANQISILEKQMGSSFFDADQYVDLQLEKLDEEGELEEIQFLAADERFSITRAYQAAFNQSIDWNFENVIAPEQIKRVADSLSANAIQSRVIAYQQQKIKLAEREYSLEKANINIGFLQAEFDNRRVEQSRTPINISGGVTIPIFNPNKGDMTKKRLDKIDAHFDLEEAQSEDKIDKMILLERINYYYERFTLLKAKIDLLKQDDVPATLQTLKGGDPAVRLKFSESVIKLEMLLGKIRRDMMYAYIDFLFTGDFLQQLPLRNYLSPRLDEL